MSFFEFIPHVPVVEPPRQSSDMGVSQASDPTQSVVHPIATVMDLEDIPAGNVRDYFLYHPYDGQLENVYISTPGAVTLNDFSIQIIQKQGSTVVAESQQSQIGDITVNPLELLIPSDFGEGAVFARVRSAAIAGQKMFITLHVRTNEIQ